MLPLTESPKVKELLIRTHEEILKQPGMQKIFEVPDDLVLNFT
jgi:hypothetical protein